MPETTVSCPNCGGDVSIASKASRVAHCPYCENTLIVNEAAIRALGKMALLANLPSCLAIGYPAKCLGREIVVLGRIQFRYDAGIWDEWWIQFLDDESNAWISQDEGSYMLEISFPKGISMPDYDSLEVGDRIEFGKRRLWVEEKNVANMVGLQGEVPRDAAPDRAVRFLQLTDNKVIASIEYYEDGSREAFQGRRLHSKHLVSDFDESRISSSYAAPNISRPGDVPEMISTGEVQPKAVACPSCGGSVELRDVGGSVMVTCAFCGSALDVSVSGSAELLYEAQKKKLPFAIDIGARGKLRQVDYTVLGRVRYRDTDESGYYVWDELQLVDQENGYAFLALEDGHWMLFTPLQRSVDADPRSMSPKQRITMDGQTYKVFERSYARVIYVEGELTWVARVGDRLGYLDAIRPPYMISAEWDTTEMKWMLGVYITPKEVAEGFGVDVARLPTRRGVAPAQPFQRSRDQRACALVGLATSMILLMLCIFAYSKQGVQLISNDQVPSHQYLSDGGYISPRFTVPDGSHICKLTVSSSGLNNSWVALSVAFLDEEDNVLLDTEANVEYYYGTEGGESWSEGSRKDQTLFRLVGPKTYRINVFGESGGSRGARVNAPVSISLYQDVAPARYFFMVALVAFIYPVWEFGRQVMFASRRWPSDDDD